MRVLNTLKALFLNDIGEEEIQENFVRINDYVRAEPILRSQFYHFELDIPGVVTAGKFKHNLGFPPKDLIQTSLIGSGSIAWDYSRFDKDFLEYTTTGPCKVRFFVGSYKTEFVR